MTAGGKTLLAGLVISAAGLAINAGAIARLRPRPQSWIEVAAASPLLLTGIVLAVLGIFIYVFHPLFDPELFERTTATVRTVLAMTAVVIVLASLLAVPYALTRGGNTSQPGPGGLTYLVFASDAPILLVVWLRILRPGFVRWESLGLRHPALRTMGQGVAGGLALFLASAVTGAVLNRFGVYQNQYERFSGVVGAPVGWFLLTLLAGCVLAPIAEELFFRAYIFKTFLERRGPAWGYLFSAGLFAVAHTNAAATAPIFVLGLLLAWIFQRTGSIVPGMIAHGLNNAVAFSVLYFGFRG